MKALTLWQPWASLVALGVKTIETRSWATRYRGELAIHAAKRPADPADMIRLVADNRDVFDRWLVAGLITEDRTADCYPMGAVVATCNLVACVSVGQLTTDGHEVTAEELSFGDYTAGRYAWILRDVRPVNPPVSVSGRQGLWDWQTGTDPAAVEQGALL